MRAPLVAVLLGTMVAQVHAGPARPAPSTPATAAPRVGIVVEIAVGVAPALAG